MKNIILKFGLLALFLCFYALPILAQGHSGGGFDEEDPAPAPIDNWIVLLVSAGIILGIYLIIKNQRKIVL